MDGYGLRYVADETSMFKLGVRVELYLRDTDDLAEPNPLTFHGEGVEWSFTDQRVIEPVRGQVKAFLSNEAGLYEAINNAREKEWRLKLILDGEAQWEGFVLPRRVRKGLDFEGEQYTEITAREHFGYLRDETPYDTTEQGALDELSLANLLRHVLEEYGDLPVEAFTDWYPMVDGVTFEEEPFGELQLDPNVFFDEEGNPLASETVLKQTAARLRARLMQADGAWQVLQMPRLTTDTRITTLGEGDPQETQENRLIEIEQDGRHVVEPSSAQGALSQVRSQSVQYNHGIPEAGSLLKNQEFNSNLQGTGGDGKDNWRPNSTEIDRTYAGGVYRVRMPGVFYESPFNLNEVHPYFIEQEGGATSGGANRRLEFDSHINYFSDGTLPTFPFQVPWQARVGSLYWDDDAGEWTEDVTTNIKEVNTEIAGTELFFETGTLEHNGENVSGNVYFRLYTLYGIEGDEEEEGDEENGGGDEQDDWNAQYRYLRVRLIDISEGEEPEATLTTVSEVDTQAGEVADDVEFLVGDGPTQIHDTRLRTDALGITDNWKIGPYGDGDDPTGYSLDRRWSEDRVQRRRYAAEKLRLTVDLGTGWLRPDAAYTWRDKRWKWERWTWRAASNQLDMRVNEIIDPDEGLNVAFAEEKLTEETGVVPRREAGTVIFKSTDTTEITGLPDPAQEGNILVATATQWQQFARGNDGQVLRTSETSSVGLAWGDLDVEAIEGLPGVLDNHAQRIRDLHRWGSDVKLYRTEDGERKASAPSDSPPMYPYLGEDGVRRAGSAFHLFDRHANALSDRHTKGEIASLYGTSIADLNRTPAERIAQSEDGSRTAHADFSALQTAAEQMAILETENGHEDAGTSARQVQRLHEVVSNLSGGLESVATESPAQGDGTTSSPVTISDNSITGSHLQDDYLKKEGGELTGFLTLHSDPEEAMHPVTRQYVEGNFLRNDKDQTLSGGLTINERDDDLRHLHLDHGGVTVREIAAGAAPANFLMSGRARQQMVHPGNGSSAGGIYMATDDAGTNRTWGLHQFGLDHSDYPSAFAIAHAAVDSGWNPSALEVAALFPTGGGLMLRDRGALPSPQVAGDVGLEVHREDLKTQLRAHFFTGETIVLAEINEAGEPPSADFSYEPADPDVDDTIQFTDESGGEVDSWSWDFDDGNTSTQENPTHSYNSTGSYTVELTVTNQWGSDTTAKTIWVTDDGAIQ